MPEEATQRLEATRRQLSSRLSQENQGELVGREKLPACQLLRQQRYQLDLFATVPIIDRKGRSANRPHL
jgi:hypothetical protein